VDLLSDTNNCAACGRVCAQCNGGACCDKHGRNCSCLAGQSWCSGLNACENLQTDSNNCGSCGNACPGGVACAAGVCACGGNQCTSGDTCCANTCADTSSDNANCGACGAVCAAGNHCDTGICCAVGLSNCSGTCVDVLTSNTSCGVCGRACTGGTVCANGSCGGSTDGGTDASVDGGADASVPGDAGSPPAICANDPCDPYCVEIDDPNPPLTADAMTTTINIVTTTTVTAFIAAGDGFGGCPPGFHSKEVNFSGCLTGGVADYSQCNTDYHCDPASGQCVRSGADWTYPAAVCPGINLTISGSCTDPATGQSTNPVCNRGNTTLDIATYPKINYYIVNGNHFDFVGADGTSCPVYGTTDSFTLPKSLAPGECINLPTPPAVHGNSVLYLNSDGLIPECGAGLGPTTGPGCYDNWADVKTGGACVPQTTTQTGIAPVPAYAPLVWITSVQATCPVGTLPQWTVLTYDVTMSSNTSGTGSVLVEAHTAGVGGAFSSWVTAADTAAPSSDPAICAFSGPAPACPKDLQALLGTAALYNPVLELRFTLTPTPDAQAMPVLNSWQAGYSCPPSL
jgi:hypothetical protein